MVRPQKVSPRVDLGIGGALTRVSPRSLAKRIKATYRGGIMRELSASNRRLIEQSGLFDASWYLTQAPEAAASGFDPLEHYFLVGWKEGRSPGPNFDAAWYRTFYNDVGAAGWEPLLHYIRYGKARGRIKRGAGGAIYDAFESLGDDCEFGNVQRRFGSQRLGLFRFASTNIDGLNAAFEHGLDNLISDSSIEIFQDEGEHRTRAASYGMLFHTHVPAALSTPGEIKAQEVRRLKLLVRNFIEDLEEGNRIFVYKSAQIPVAKMQILAGHLRRFGNNHLLGVTSTKDKRKLARLEVLSDSLALGHIEQLDWDVSTRSAELWSSICSQAHALWLRFEKAATA